ncbi:MAG: hypothetical protein ACLFVD_02770 [Dehalococcoidia bacterium]
MSEQLGKIEKLEVEHFKQGKKLYLVPLVYSGKEAPLEYKEKCDRYWQQVAEQLTSLSSKIGSVRCIYHESVFEAGDQGMKAIEKLSPRSYQIAKAQWDNGATLEAVEQRELLEEVMDWQRCLMLGFMSQKVAGQVAGSYADAAKRRNELIARRIAETLKDDEAGLLFIQEGHGVQFPLDIEVFTIFPPVLDEIHRWLRSQARPGIGESEEEPAGATEEPKKKSGKRAKRKPKP